MNYNKDKIAPYTDLITNISSQFDIDKDMVKAIIWQESSGDTWAARWEPRVFMSHHAVNFALDLRITYETESTFQHTSWGLMQPLGVVARELGFKEMLPKLCLPEVGIYWGCKKLAKIKERHQALEDIISIYNFGSIRMVGGNYINQSYVDSVKSNLFEARKNG